MISACFDNVRVSRKTYFLTSLVYVSVCVLLSLITGFIGTFSETLALIFLLASGLVVTVAGIKLAINRLHDTNKSGWYVLLAIVPFIGIFLTLYLFFAGSDEEGVRFTKARI